MSKLSSTVCPSARTNTGTVPLGETLSMDAGLSRNTTSRNSHVIPLTCNASLARIAYGQRRKEYNIVDIKSTDDLPRSGLTGQANLCDKLTMFVVTVSEPGGQYYSLLFGAHEVSIGRDESCDITLDDGNVSQQHAQISYRDGKFIIVDTGSTNGIYVNEVLVTKPVMIDGPDEIHIATFVLQVSVVREMALVAG